MIYFAPQSYQANVLYKSQEGRRVHASKLKFVLPMLLAVAAAAQQAQPAPEANPIFTLQEVMIPVRDGIHLQTVILTPVDQKGPLPILFRRTPYGVPDKPLAQMPSSLKALAQDGYIFVFQNLRGRFKSEGVFNLSSWVDLNDPKATNETTDAYDSIEWLVKTFPTTMARWVCSASLTTD